MKLAALGWEELMAVMSGQETCVWSLEMCRSPSASMPAAVWTLAARFTQKVKAVAAGELHRSVLAMGIGSRRSACHSNRHTAGSCPDTDPVPAAQP